MEQKRVEALQVIDDIKDIYRKRSAVIGFRCGVICLSSQTLPEEGSSASLQDNSPLPLEGSGEAESDACLAFAWMMAEYVLKEQCKMFGDGLVDERQSMHLMKNDKNTNVLTHLPEQFGIEELRSIKGNTFSDNTLTQIISRWRKDGWIEKVAKGKWHKVAP